MRRFRGLDLRTAVSQGRDHAFGLDLRCHPTFGSSLYHSLAPASGWGSWNSMVEYVISGRLSTLGVDPSNKKSPCMTLQPEKTPLTCVDDSSWMNQTWRLKPFNIWLELQLEWHRSPDPADKSIGANQGEFIVIVSVTPSDSWTSLLLTWAWKLLLLQCKQAANGSNRNQVTIMAYYG